MPERRRVPVGKDNRPQVPESLPLEPGPAACDCPHLDPADWHEVESDWSDITFLRAGTKALLGVPVGYNSARDKLEKNAAKLGLTVPADAMFLLGAGKFRRPVMLEVEGAQPGQKGVLRPGGVAYSRLLPVPWGEMQRAVEETAAKAKARYGGEPTDVWVWYLTCRECSSEREYETLILAHYAHLP